MAGADAQLDLGDGAAWGAAALLLLACLVGAVVLAEWPLVGTTPESPDQPNLVRPADNGTQLWPYTARSTTYRSRTLGINLVFYGEPDRVRTALQERSELNWTVQQANESDADSDTISSERVEINPDAENLSDAVSWRSARGSTRYTYVEVDGEGRWTGSTYQLHSGQYLGSRMHIRAYEDPQGEWTAVQIHREHWDWFRLRHTVTGLSDPQRRIEEDFMDEPFVDEVGRMFLDNGTGDSDGWATDIHLSGHLLSLLVVGIVARTRRVKRVATKFARRYRSEILLGTALFVLYAGIRYVAIAGELLLSGISPKFVAAPLYLILVAGVPSIAYLFGKRSAPSWAFAFATLGLGAAFVGDFAAMGVSVLPLRVVLHRAAVLLAVGLVALGGSLAVDRDDWPTPLLLGIAGWAVVLVAPIFGYL